MSDTPTEVDCSRHGRSQATFVCRHLARGSGQGFHHADEPDNPRPDAWCDGCDEVLEQEGEWNERSEAIARITLLCAGCYDEVRSRNEQRVEGAEPRGFRCSTCGEQHDAMPMDFGFDAPLAYLGVPEQERATRCDLTPDLCIIDGEHFFIRGCLEIPVLDGPRPFTWGVWASLSEKNFRRANEVWDSNGRHEEPPYFGWLSNAVPLYPDTLHLATMVHTRPKGQRPFIELEPTDHPLAVDQRQGITLDRVRQIAETLLHEQTP